MGMELNITSNLEHSCSSVKQEIVRALVSALKNETTEYNKLLLEWRDLQIEDPESNNFLQCRLKALSQAVSYINERDHELLLSYVLGMSLWMHTPDVATALTEFVVNLASVSGGCVVQCLDMLVRNFLPPSCGLPVFVDFYSRRALMRGMPKEMLVNKKNEHLERKVSILQLLHSAVRRIVELVPMAVMHLHPIVLQRMPHRLVDKEWNALYLENMLRLEEDGKGEFIRNQMLMAVVDRLIEIDVEIRWEDIVREDDSSKIFVFDMECDEVLEENEAGSVGARSEVQQLAGVLKDSDGNQKLSLCAVADKMDVLMDMTLQHLQHCVGAGRCDQVFSTLMSSFQSTIIDTYKSKFTQFLIFSVCSLDPKVCGEKFASLLCEIITSTHRAPNTRMSAAAYLASFLARAKFLPLPVISSSLKRIVSWCVNYIPRQSDKRGGLTVDAGIHGVLYSACQAVMYVLCFRMKTLLDDPNERDILYSLPINDLLTHSLNPLKLCLPSVVDEFLKQATTAHFVEKKLASELSESIEAVASNTFGGIKRLDMFFPFDPYLLRQSDRFIRPNFIFWSMVTTPEEDEVSDADSEGNENDSENLSAAKVIHGQQFQERIERSQASAEMQSVEEEIDSVSKDEEDLDDFEMSMTRMSLTPSDNFLKQFMMKQPLPLPAKLTPELLRQFSNPFR